MFECSQGSLAVDVPEDVQRVEAALISSKHMLNSISDYKALVFDCDGVVLDSNRIKTEAFRIAALPWG